MGVIITEMSVLVDQSTKTDIRLINGNKLVIAPANNGFGIETGD
jgi:hypothetical protein